jgi:hypothetical protein
MFSKPTVFIIGAGASAEFGMPLGGDLKAAIDGRVKFTGAAPSEALSKQIIKSVGGLKTMRLAELGHLLSRAIPRFGSMDEVLHFLSHDDEIVYLGKIAIAHEILVAERRSHLFNAIHGLSTWEQCDISWAGRFFDLALSGTKLAEIEAVFRNVTVIDFNYDRVLPQYLHSTLVRSFALSPDWASKCLAELTILHPYGSVGPLDWEGVAKTVEFGASDYNLSEIANRIKTYTEERDGTQLATIRKAIHQAHVAVVLGFGFHNQNIDLLNVPDLGPGPGRQLFMTVMGIDEQNHRTIEGRMRGALRVGGTTQTMPELGSEFLRKLQPSIAIAIS